SAVVVEEQWTKSGDTLLMGVSTTAKNKQVKSSETVRIKLLNDSLFYDVTVSNQNDGKSIRFKMVELNDSLVQFENKQHDFPTRIEYKKLTDSTCLATISGMINGEL